MGFLLPVDLMPGIECIFMQILLAFRSSIDYICTEIHPKDTLFGCFFMPKSPIMDIMLTCRLCAYV